MDKTELERLLWYCSADTNQITDPEIRKFIGAAKKLLTEIVRELEGLKLRVNSLEE